MDSKLKLALNSFSNRFRYLLLVSHIKYFFDIFRITFSLSLNLKFTFYETKNWKIKQHTDYTILPLSTTHAGSALLPTLRAVNHIRLFPMH